MHEEAEPGAAGVPLVGAAAKMAAGLMASTDRAVLLHGDFLDKNILLGPDGYVAIDPMPRLGDPCADVGMFASFRQPASVILTTARTMAELLGYDTRRCEQWAAVWSVGEACETWREDSDELQAWIQGAEVAALLGSN